MKPWYDLWQLLDIKYHEQSIACLFSLLTIYEQIGVGAGGLGTEIIVPPLPYLAVLICTILLSIVSLSYDKFVINEDEREIAPDFLEVTSVTGSVAPSILCVTSSTRDIAVWSKNGGLPVGVTVSNGYALVGYAVKLNWRKKVHFTDSGTYTCRITSGESGTVTVLEIRLTVLSKLKLHTIFPEVP